MMYRIKYKASGYLKEAFDSPEACETHIDGRLAMSPLTRDRSEYRIFRITEVELVRVPVTTYEYKEVK